MRTEQTPKITDAPRPGDDDAKRITHPAFGTVQLSRISGNTNLFDSAFRHQYYIVLRINKATMDRSLSRNWIHGNDAVAEVAMSEAQFATMISSIGVGSGVPCTLQRVVGEQVPGIVNIQTEAQQHTAEFDVSMQDAMNRIDALSEQIEAARMSKKLKNSLIRSADSIRSAIGSNLKFVADSFGRAMEKTVQDAKVEITAYAKISGVDGRLKLDTDQEKPEAIE